MRKRRCEVNGRNWRRGGRTAKGYIGREDERIRE